MRWLLIGLGLLLIFYAVCVYQLWATHWETKK
jgi:hypothetical protein